MKSRVRELCEIGNRLFAKRQPLLTIWQTMAENFYPIRADFVTSRSLGEEFASNLMTGRPVLAHRELGNALASMLRPRGQAWFRARVQNEKVNEDATAKQWLDAKSDVMRRMMDDPRAKFVRATKEGDNDFVAFGQCAITAEVNRDRDGAMYRAHHLRDVAWCENDEQVIDIVHLNWQREVRALCKAFGDKVHRSVKTALEKEPYKEIKCRRIIMPAEDYDYTDKEKRPKKEFPFISIHVDIENETILEEVPINDSPWVIPRWVTIAGSQYAYSPSTVVALPDARLLQAMSLTLLEAGQKAVDPPMKATAEAIQGGVNSYAGGLTWVDAEYDERNGKAIETLMDINPNLQWGENRELKVEALINEAFYLNAIQVPYPEGDMTATEFRFRVEEYIRRALPLFEPMEVEYNGSLCEKTFNIGMRLGAFGSPWDMPQILRGQEMKFSFESPLQAATERAKSQAFMDAANLLKVAAELDPASKHAYDVTTAFRDALSGIAPAKWIVPEEKAQHAEAIERRMQEMQAMAMAVQQGAEVAGQVGVAGQELAAAGQMAQAMPA